MSDLESELFHLLQILNRRLWEDHASRPLIEKWLGNFASSQSTADRQKERIHALYLLSKFMYFGAKEVRALLKALYRERFQYPLVAKIRKASSNSKDVQMLKREFSKARLKTRFIGLGNPSESGAHLLYPFRQENNIPRDLFISAYQIFDRSSSGKPTIRDPNVERYIFIDDFCGSGDQAEELTTHLISELRSVSQAHGATLFLAYYCLVATTDGLTAVRALNAFDDVQCVVELDETFRCFGATSRYFRNTPQEIDIDFAEQLSLFYGSQLVPDHPQGYSNSQLLIGFQHNTPDNTLPIIWGEESWQPIFRRFNKLQLKVLPPHSLSKP